MQYKVSKLEELPDRTIYLELIFEFKQQGTGKPYFMTGQYYWNNKPASPEVYDTLDDEYKKEVSKEDFELKEIERAEAHAPKMALIKNESDTDTESVIEEVANSLINTWKEAGILNKDLESIYYTPTEEELREMKQNDPNAPVEISYNGKYKEVPVTEETKEEVKE